MDRVKAIFVSHEHTDHISGIAVLAKKYHLPVYATFTMIERGVLNLRDHILIPFRSHDIITIGALSVKAFPKHHDACDPHSFTISNEKVTIGVFTDIGHVCEQLISHFKNCHAAFLEANYDEEMLESGRYPYYLKTRIRGGKGHLSNMQALELFVNHKPDFMSHVLLSHLSKDNNDPELVARLFTERAGDTEVVVASRYRESAVYYISSDGGREHVRVQQGNVQMSLF